MRREEYIQVLDGTHPDHGPGVSFAHQGLIIASAIAIALETVPQLPQGPRNVLLVFEVIVVALFVMEYIARVICAPKPLRYIFSAWGIIDLLSCLPALFIIQSQWAALRTFRVLRIVRVLKLLHANRALMRLELALAQIRGELLVFAFLAAIVLYIAAVGIFVFEHDAQPEAFSSVPKSLWWAIVSFTTVGYGDIYPITAAGRIFTAGVLFIGLGVIAVPTALITTALVNTEIREAVEREVGEEIGDIEREVRKDLAPLKRRPTRRP